MFKKVRERLFFCFMAFVAITLLSFTFVSSIAYADTIIDNGGSGTSFTGVWSTSGGSSPYGAGSYWSRDGARYTWSFSSQPAGTYRVHMWWSAWPSRASSINVSINHDGGPTPWVINQSVNAGQWNSLGEYLFGTSGSVTITAAYGSTVSTCADAVWFEFISGNTAPTAYIDSITPNPADSGQPVSFSGHGTDDGSISGFSWESNIDNEFFSDQDSFSTSSLKDGVHTISFKVKDDEGMWSEPVTEVLTVGSPPVEVIIDNDDPGTSFSGGSWGYSSGANPYGGSSRAEMQTGATYTFEAAVTGEHEVSLWWTYWSSRCSAVPVGIYDGNTLLATVPVNQHQLDLAGKWNVLGSYTFSGTARVVIRAQSGCSSCADAVKFVSAEPAELSYIVITGAASVNENSSADYTCTAHYTDGSSHEVQPDWIENSGYATISPTGLLTTTEVSSSVPCRISATYEENGITRSDGLDITIENYVPPELDYIEIEGPSSVNENSSADYRCIAHYTDGSSHEVEPDTWYENSGYATISPTGLLTTTEVGSSEPCRISATYEENGITRSDDLDITIENYVLPGLDYIEVEGPASVNENSSADYRCIAHYTDGSSHEVEPDTWDENSGYATISPTGLLTTTEVGSSELCRISATYTENSITESDDLDITIQNYVPPVELIIDNGDSGTSYSGGQWGYSSGADPYGGSSQAESVTGAMYTFEGAVTGYQEVSLWWTYWSSRCSAVPVDIYDGTTLLDTVTSNQRQLDLAGQWNVLGTYSFSGTARVVIRAQNGCSACADAVKFKPIQGNPSIIIDNRDSRTSQTGTWSVSGAANPYSPIDPDADSFWSRDGSTFTWHFSPPQSGVYEVSMWWTAWSSRSTNVPVNIEHDGETATVYINQQENGGQWNSQGHFYFQTGTTYDIRMTSQPAPSSTCADAIKFSYFNDGPFVEIAEPSSYHLQTSPDLVVRANAVNLELTWKIKFIMDLGTPDERSIFDASEPYEVLFTGVTKKEHTVDVFVVDGSNLEVPGTYSHVQIIQVGIGNYYVAIGDSITEGFGDDDPSDDISLDGRNGGGGYEPILNNLLTDASPSRIPHTIINEGVGGITSLDGMELISAYLSKHPESQRFLVQYGTNDSNLWFPIPSGKGLTSEDPGYPGSFKENMQTIIDEINAEGKEVCLSKLPIALGDDPYSSPYDNPDLDGERNVLIKEYNDVIDELKNDPLNDITVIPPDFYSLFNEDVPGGKRYDFEYADNLHPNGTGYRSMANHWLEPLAP